jgi:hypothetical protein
MFSDPDGRRVAQAKADSPAMLAGFIAHKCTSGGLSFPATAEVERSSSRQRAAGSSRILMPPIQSRPTQRIITVLVRRGQRGKSAGTSVTASTYGPRSLTEPGLGPRAPFLPRSSLSIVSGRHYLTKPAQGDANAKCGFYLH